MSTDNNISRASRAHRPLLSVVAMVAVLLTTAACDSPTQMVSGILEKTGLASEASEELAADFEEACNHYVTCASESAQNEEEQRRLRDMGRACEASGMMVSIVSVLGPGCEDSARTYIQCVSQTSCDELAQEDSPQSACAGELEAMRQECENSTKQNGE